MEFSTNKYHFKMLNEDELKKLKAGDKVTVCVSMNLPESAEFTDTVVINPAFWNCDSDEHRVLFSADSGRADGLVQKIDESRLCPADFHGCTWRGQETAADEKGGGMAGTPLWSRACGACAL